MRASGGALVVGILLTSAVSVRSPAARADRGQVTLSLTPAASVIKTKGDWSWGGGGAIDLAVAITDALALRLTGATTSHALSPKTDAATGLTTDPGGSVLAYHAGAGVIYTIDILRLVPTIEFSIGLLGTAKQPPGGAYSFKYDFGISAGLGLDYLIDRRWSIGGVLRYQATLTSPDEIPAYIYFGPRVGFRFN